LEVGQHQPVARGPLPAARLAVGRDGGRVLRHHAAQVSPVALGRNELRIETAGERAREREAFVGKFDRRRDEILPRQVAEAVVRELQAANGAGHARGEIAFVGQVDVDLAVAQIHRARGFAGRLLAVVECRDLAVGGAHDHESAAADVAGARMGHREREGGGDGSVHGIATSGENRGAGVARGRRRAYDHPVFRRDALVGCGRDGTRQSRREQQRQAEGGASQ